MKKYVADNPSGLSSPTRWHIFSDCPSIAGIASEVDDDFLVLAGVNPSNKGLCRACMKRSLTRAYERRRKAVNAFCPSQTTFSFSEGAPQRESYESDADYFAGERKYVEEWKRKYKCRGCGDAGCPQCGTLDFSHGP